ncbi:MAG: hypothetical protein GEU28_13130 [Dehalococcoidia bacterium]|nr:hypothetical protein [Dehalococcoidia bacterium]
MSITPSDPRLAAENAFRHALEERRHQIRDAGLRFDPRSETQLEKAYDEGNLLSGLCEGVARFKPPGDPVRLQAMARLIKRGIDTWEHVLIRPGAPWERYVTPEARRGARAAIAEAQKVVPFV